jgi:hypothetical protein
MQAKIPIGDVVVDSDQVYFIFRTRLCLRVSHAFFAVLLQCVIQYISREHILSKLKGDWSLSRRFFGELALLVASMPCAQASAVGGEIYMY